VVGLDDSPQGELAVQEGLRRAAARGAALHVVSVLGGYDPLQQREYAALRMNLDGERAELHERVLAICERRSGPLPEIHEHVLVGPPAKELARAARSLDADLVIVGTHGRRGVGRLVLGSVAEEILRQVPCSVLVVRDKSWPDA
jgi:nucleotide-binding universal stress UspA family protein